MTGVAWPYDFVSVVVQVVVSACECTCIVVSNSFTNHYRMCSLTLECGLLLQCVVYSNFFSNHYTVCMHFCTYVGLTVLMYTRMFECVLCCAGEQGLQRTRSWSSPAEARALDAARQARRAGQRTLKVHGKTVMFLC